MSEVSSENIVAAFRRLPLPEQETLLGRLIEEFESERSPQDTATALPVPEKDRSREEQWLAEHSREYAGQWVALNGDQLIAHSFDSAEVFAAVRAPGVDRPLYVLVESPDAPPFAGF